MRPQSLEVSVRTSYLQAKHIRWQGLTRQASSADGGLCGLHGPVPQRLGPLLCPTLHLICGHGNHPPNGDLAFRLITEIMQQRGSQAGQTGLVGPHRPGERMFLDLLNQVGPSNNDPGLRPPQ